MADAVLCALLHRRLPTSPWLGAGRCAGGLRAFVRASLSRSSGGAAQVAVVALPRCSVRARRGCGCGERVRTACTHATCNHPPPVLPVAVQLEDLRASLGEQEKVLATMVGKRGRIATTVAKWKDHVATLHDAHEALANPRVARRKARGDDFPEPPPTGSVLSAIGVASPGELLRRCARGGAIVSHFAAVLRSQEGLVPWNSCR